MKTVVYFNDLLLAPIWSMATLLGLYSAWLYWRRRCDGASDAALRAIVTFYASVSATAILMGSLRILSGCSLLLGTSAASLWLLRLSGRWEAGTTHVPTSPLAHPQTREDQMISKSWNVLYLFLFLVFCVHIIFNGILQIPEDFDSLLYHIPLIDQWIQTKSLSVVDGPNWSNPGGNELLGLWMVAPFSGDFLISLNNAANVAILALASTCLARECGANRDMSLLVGLVSVANSVVIRQAIDARNDVAVAGLLIGAVYFLFLASRTPNLYNIICSSMCLGLLAGTKYYALGYAASAWSGGALLFVLRRGLRSSAVTTLSIFFGSLAFGGYWYARNALITGTPFYPMYLQAKHNLMAILYPDLWNSTLAGGFRLELLPRMMAIVLEKLGLWYAVAISAMPLIGPWLFLRGIRCQNEEPRSRSIALAWVTTSSWFVYSITPLLLEDAPGTLNQLDEGSTPARYGLGVFVLSSLMLAVSMSSFAGYFTSAVRGRMSMSGACLLISATQIASLFEYNWQNSSDDLVTASWPPARKLPGEILDFSLTLFITISILYLIINAKNYKLTIFRSPILNAILISIAISICIAPLSSRWHSNFFYKYDLLRLNDTFKFASLPLPDRLCVLDGRCYPFYGPARGTVVWRPIWVPDYQWLVEMVDRNGIGSVVVRYDAINPHFYPKVDGWLSEHPEDFATLRRKNGLSVYRRLAPARVSAHSISSKSAAIGPGWEGLE